MAVIVPDEIDYDLDRLAAITHGVERIDDPARRAHVLSALWLGVYSAARDRGERALAEIAAAGFFFHHALHESLTAPP